MRSSTTTRVQLVVCQASSGRAPCRVPSDQGLGFELRSRQPRTEFQKHLLKRTGKLVFFSKTSKLHEARLSKFVAHHPAVSMVLLSSVSHETVIYFFLTSRWTWFNFGSGVRSRFRECNCARTSLSSLQKFACRKRAPTNRKPHNNRRSSARCVDLSKPDGFIAGSAATFFFGDGFGLASTGLTFAGAPTRLTSAGIRSIWRHNWRC